MKRDERKKRKKRLREEKREADRRRYLAAKAQDVFPKILIDPTDGDAALVRHIEQIVAHLDLADPEVLHPNGQEFLKLVRREGREGMMEMVRIDAMHSDDPHAFKHHAKSVLLMIGQRIFERLPAAFQEKPLPFYYFDVQTADHNLQIKFDFLPSKTDALGRVYHPPHGTEARFEGNAFPVGFTRHAIERACERMTFTHPLTFHQFQYCRLYFTHCQRYEGVEWGDGKFAFAMYNTVGGPGNDIHDIYVTKILQPPPDAHVGRVYYLMGYCPVDFRVGRAVAMTFLPPGYGGTPEDRLVRSAPIDRDLRRRLLDAATNNTFERVLEGNDDVIKWYHDNGVPQVKEMPPGMFKHISSF